MYLCALLVYTCFQSFVVADQVLKRDPKGFSFGNFVAHHGTKLAVDSPRSVLVDSPDDCSFACLKSPTCFSVNFETRARENRQHLCELLSTDKYNSSTNLSENSADFLHLSLKVWSYDYRS